MKPSGALRWYPATIVLTPPPPQKSTRAGGRILLAVVAPFQAFFRLQASGGLVMMASAALALVWANSPLRSTYEAVFHATIELKLADRGIEWSVHHFTNDALMTLFFVVAGLEVKRELVQGELRQLRQAILPLLAAAGGMLAPAAIYLVFNPVGPSRAGWAVPMATDLAFAAGCLSLVRRRVTTSVFVFLTALAIFDDLGSIGVIALFYGGAIDFGMLGVAVALAALLFFVGRRGVQSMWPFWVLGGMLWVAALLSGVHATVAGVVIGLALPATPSRAPSEALDDLDQAISDLRHSSTGSSAALDGAIAAVVSQARAVQSPLERAMHALHGVVAYAIVPLFALANAGIAVGAGPILGSKVTLGALVGLVLGKPVGILGMTWLVTRLKLAERPAGSTWAQVVGASLLAGVGFTMSLLIGNLGFGHERGLEDQAKLGVLVGSVISAGLGLAVLRRYSPLSDADDEQAHPWH